MEFKDLYNNFIKSTKENFPNEECVNGIEEEYIYESNQKYYCLIIDKRFSSDYAIRVLRPYICKTKEYGDLYAWTCGNDFVDNMENSVHGACWDEYVIGFAKYEDTNEEKIEEILNIIEKNGE